jgi:putative solute:sodium symporter small subunit
MYQRWNPWYWLLLVPCVGLLWVPFFNRVEPEFFGIPFFYWYQLAWVPISAILTGIVYARTSREVDETWSAKTR